MCICGVIRVWKTGIHIIQQILSIPAYDSKWVPLYIFQQRFFFRLRFLKYPVPVSTCDCQLINWPSGYSSFSVILVNNSLPLDPFVMTQIKFLTEHWVRGRDQLANVNVSFPEDHWICPIPSLQSIKVLKLQIEIIKLCKHTERRR